MAKKKKTGDWAAAKEDNELDRLEQEDSEDSENDGLLEETGDEETKEEEY